MGLTSLMKSGFGGSKSWLHNAKKDLRVAAKVASRTLGGSGSMGSIGRWAMGGAALGALRGAADGMIGEDRTSIIGGAMQGAVIGGGIRGMKVGWNRMNMKRGAKSVSTAMAGGSSRYPNNPWMNPGSASSVFSAPVGRGSGLSAALARHWNRGRSATRGSLKGVDAGYVRPGIVNPPDGSSAGLASTQRQLTNAAFRLAQSGRNYPKGYTRAGGFNYGGKA